jgi:uncharacterized DUF497 family protein
VEFEWDPRKAAANRRKHGVSFMEATTAFRDAWSVTCHDPRFVGEDRFLMLGVSERGRLLVVVYVERGERVRIISARRATARERHKYEEGA